MFADLKNKTIVITGAAQGLGLAMTKKFAQLGAEIWMLDIQTESLDTSKQNVLKNIPKANLQTLTCDITKATEVLHASDTIQACDILINNAGILRDASLFKLSLENWQSVIDVHLTGAFLMTQAFGQKMKENNSGSIINLSSVASQGNFGQTNYSAAKAGIIGMTKTWALELSKYNIRVNAIAPGLIETQMTASIPEKIRQTMIQKIPLQRMGEPQEVASLACFLASQASSYLTGQLVHITGGYYL